MDNDVFFIIENENELINLYILYKLKNLFKNDIYYILNGYIYKI